MQKLLLILLCLFPFVSQALAIEEKEESLSLKEGFRWENGLLSGDFKEIPVISFLEELSLRAGFELTIMGELDAKMTMSFKKVPLEEAIKRVMRISDLSYVVIFDDKDILAGGKSNWIRKLIVFSQVKNLQAAPRRAIREISNPDKASSLTYERKPRSPSQESSLVRIEPHKEIPPKSHTEFEGSKQELKNYVDKLSRERRLSPEEYKRIMEEIKKGNSK